MKELLASALASLLLLLPLPAPVPTEGEAPEAESLELQGRREMLLGGRLAARDADGEIVSFEITTRPRKGEVWLGSDGRFVYAPREGRRGNDYFGYRAWDNDGNRSQEATVIIRMEK